MSNYAELLTHRNVQAFLALIKYTDGAGYHTLFGGERFSSFSDNHRRKITRTLGDKPITSTKPS